ncbi:MAG: AAA family ATPase [Burkholderiaceae bacterium]
MKLSWFEAREIKRFVHGVRIADFEPGINVFSGPNGSGKSSIIQALRAAFLERYQTKAVADLLPWGKPAAQPSVEVHFEHNGSQYQLRKQFLKSASAVLTHRGQRLENVNADNELARLFGFSLASKGKNRADNYGVPGLLWIEQGHGQELDMPLAGARGFLRDALGHSIGDITSSEGDAVLSQLQAERDELLAVNSDKPKGAFDKALKALSQIDEQVAKLQEQCSRYRLMVDELSTLQKVRRRLSQDRPWLILEEQIEQAQRDLREGEALESRRTNLSVDRQRLMAEVALIQSRLNGWASQASQVDLRRQALAVAKSELDEADEGARQAERDYQQKLSALRLVRRSVESRRDADQLRRLGEEFSAASQALSLREQQIANACQLQDRITDLNCGRVATGVKISDVNEMRELELSAQLATSRREILGTHLQWQLRDDIQLQLNGRPIEADGRTTLTRVSEIEIPEVGMLRVHPGQTIEAGEADNEQQVQARLTRLRQQFQIQSAVQLEQQLQLAIQQEKEIQLLTDQLARVAPGGLADLVAQRDKQQAILVSIKQRQSGLPSQASASALPSRPNPLIATEIDDPEDAQSPIDEVDSLTNLEAELERCQIALTRSEQLRNMSVSELTTRRAGFAAAEKELNDLLRLLNESERATLIQAETQSQQDLARELAGLDEQLLVIDEQSKQINTDMLRQDIERLTHSARAVRRSHEDNEAQCRILEGRLSEAGASGAEEQLAELTASQTRLQRQADKFQRRANALNLLINRLEKARQFASEQLQAPLRKHIDHYLRLLFPSATLDLTSELAPGQLLPDGVAMADSGTFDAQSFGTREQLALVSRLAYADLLQLSGLPTLIILDDGLVHTDAERLASMKRILFDAARRHQILLFTCHEERWLDMGVSPRDVRNLPVAEPPTNQPGPGFAGQ